jgi:TPR repeat protein
MAEPTSPFPWTAALAAIALALATAAAADDTAERDRLLPRAKAGDAAAQFNLGQLHRYSSEMRLRKPQDAETWLLAAAKQDHLPAILSLVELYQQHDLGADPAMVAGWMARAADLGDVGSRHRLGVLLWSGPRGVATDRPRALTLLRSAAAAGENDALVFLANESLEGAGARRDPAVARDLLALAAGEGSMPAAIFLQVFDPQWHRLPKLPLAVRSLETAAKSGDAAAMLLLGRAHETGTGVRAAAAGEGTLASSLAEARRWYRRAADAGSAEAEARLGVLVARGTDGPADRAAALQLFQSAAAKGDALGQLNFAVMLLQGLASDPDPRRPVELLTAASARRADARFELGMLHYEGNLVAKDLARARELFLQAARDRNAKAMANLGVIAYNGELGPADRAEADQWWRLAAANGSSDAQRFLRATSARLSPAVGAASAARTKEWEDGIAAARLARIPEVVLRD